MTDQELANFVSDVRASLQRIEANQHRILKLLTKEGEEGFQLNVEKT